MDDRTDEEKDENSSRYIYKSRYGPVYSYISSHEYIQDFHNDYPKMPIDKKIYKTLIENDFSDRLATHFSNLLIRDPLVIFDEKLNLQEKDVSHFENFNSTNWNSLRFKPPRDQDNDTCFKVEIRPCELQLTPFENSAIMTFCLILSKLILKKDVNFIIPITKVDKNFDRAHNANAFENELFYFRVDAFKNYNKESKLYENDYLKHGNPLDENYFDKNLNLENVIEMTLEEIFCGSEKLEYEGLLNVMNDFVNENISDEKLIKIIKLHLNFIKNRVKGKKCFYYI